MSFNASYEGKVGDIKIMPDQSFSFSEQTNEIRKKVDIKRVLDFIQKIVKNSLHEQHYKQIGRLPKFFNTDEKQRIDQY